MGNVLQREGGDVGRVDDGFAFPTGTAYAKTDCDLRVVRRLVLERRLMPFYKGEENETAAATIECPICFLVRFRRVWLAG